MKPHFVEARDLPDAWFQLVDLCYKEGRDYRVTEGSYADAQFRRELDYVTVHIRQPWAMPLLPEIPPGLGIPNPVPEGMDYVERYLPYLMTDERKEGEQYTYGERLFAPAEHIVTANGVVYADTDYLAATCQVEEVIEKFRRSFGNNQACMTIAQPGDIHLPDPPCLRQIDCRIYSDGDDGNRLHFAIYFRSWDLWGGFPANLAAIVHLQEYMAARIGVGPGEFICASKGLHLYDMYWELARIRLGEKEQTTTPTGDNP
jgi:thymidylate synthase